MADDLLFDDRIKSRWWKGGGHLRMSERRKLGQEDIRRSKPVNLVAGWVLVPVE
jgi:hypothetical protein